MKQINVKRLAMIGLLMALVFVASLLSVPIPTSIGNTRLHLGNVMCLLSGLLLGPLAGGLAAGFGSMFYDFTNPLFVPYAPLTLIFKFFMAWICGVIAWSGGAGARRIRRNIAGAVVGAVLYVLLYLGQNFVQDYWFLRMELGAVWIDLAQKGATSLFNGVIAVVAAIPLSAALRAALDRNGLMPVRKDQEKK